MLTLVVFLAACAPQPASVSVEGPQAITVHSLDAVALPGATVAAADGADLTQSNPVAWSAAPEGIVTIDTATGMLTPVAEGQVTLTATSGPAAATVSFTVGLPDAVAIVGVASGDTLAVGEQRQLTGQVLDAGAPVEGLAVTFESSTPEVVQIGADGSLTAVAPGQATLKATHGELTGVATVYVDAAALTDVAAPTGEAADL